MNRRKHTKTDQHLDQQLDELLANAHQRQWTGPDHSPKVDRYLNSKGLTMNSQPNRFLSHSALILLGVGALTGASLAAVVTHTIMSRSATIITDDGTEYNVELLETPEGASGTFVTDDGTSYYIDTAVQDAQEHISVDINSPKGGTSTFIFDNGMAPSITTEPGQAASFEIGESNDEKSSKSDE